MVDPKDAMQGARTSFACEITRYPLVSFIAASGGPARARERFFWVGIYKTRFRVVSFCKQSCPKATKFLGSFARLPWRGKSGSDEVT
jgi:hypothetical protein